MGLSARTAGRAGACPSRGRGCVGGQGRRRRVRLADAADAQFNGYAGLNYQTMSGQLRTLMGAFVRQAQMDEAAMAASSVTP